MLFMSSVPESQICLLPAFRFWEDAGEANKDEKLESLSAKFMSGVGPHVSAEAGTENMFSGSNHFNDPRKTNMSIRMYERMVILRHRIHRTYVSVQNVIRLYMSRERGNDWDEDEDRDMNEYLQEEEKIWRVEHPATTKKMFGEETEAETTEGVQGKPCG